MSKHPITSAIEIVGLQPLGKALGVTYQAVRKWERQGHLPRTEWTGETRYAERIEALTSGQVRQADLMACRPGKQFSDAIEMREAA